MANTESVSVNEKQWLLESIERLKREELDAKQDAWETALEGMAKGTRSFFLANFLNA